MEASTSIALICPRCRAADRAFPLLVDELTCSNLDCGHAYPTLAGTDIPFVAVGSFEDYAALDAEASFSDADGVAVWIETLETASPEWELALRIGMYATAHYEQPRSLASRLYDRFIADLPIEIQSAVDLGCGVGGFSVELASHNECEVIGLDASGLSLRMADAAWAGGTIAIPELYDGVRLRARSTELPPPRPGRIRWLAADVHNPPLMAHGFDLVSAINLIDTAAAPRIALRQAAALVRPGGYLLLAQPDAWNTPATDPEHWLPSNDATWDNFLQQLGLETVDRDDGFTWELARTPRYRFQYTSHARLARRVTRAS